MKWLALIIANVCLVAGRVGMGLAWLAFAVLLGAADEASEGEPDADCTGEGGDDEGEQDSWPAVGTRRPF